MTFNFDVTSLINNLETSTDIIQAFAIISGLTLFLMGLFKLKRYGEMRTFMSTQMTMAKPLMLIICGALLLWTPLLINTVVAAFWGANAVNQYPHSSIPQLQQMEDAITIFVRVIGVCAFLRGWIMLAKSGGEGQQPGVRGKALIHIFAGVLLIHIILTMDLLKQLMGFT